ncbi:lamin tail domain-containing protein [Candidatus Woesearchaeota archaeon]|nr:lamin tail domain-containing protein [Candidatus Woesearchaeota archaeon]
MHLRKMFLGMGWFWFLVLILSPAHGQLEITEVMYAPSGGGDEWVEIFNNASSTINFSLWKFQDTKENDSFACCFLSPACSLLLSPQSFALVTDQDTSFFPENVTQICVDDNDLGNGLHNDGDNLTLTNGTAFDFLSYTKNTNISKNNKTLEKVAGAWRESFFPFGTPGKRNEEPFQEIPPPQDNQSNQSNSGSTPITDSVCDLALDIVLDNPIFPSEKISFSLIAKNVSNRAVNISVRGNILTPEGKIIKKYSPWTDDRLSGQLLRSYEPSLPTGIYVISFWMVNTSCTDMEATNNKVSRLLAVLSSSADQENSEEQENTDSSLKIEEISLGNDELAAEGESIPVKVEIYKGNTSKTLVELKAKKAGKLVSETSKVYMQKKYSFLEATVPLQLRCGFEEGEVTVSLEGLGTKTENNFIVKGVGKRCQKTEETESADKENEIEQERNEEQELPENEDASLISTISQKFNFTFQNVPEIVSTGENFHLQVRVKNDALPHTYTVWAYLYRGSRCYSCKEQTKERNESRQVIQLHSGEEKKVEFLLPVDADVDAGEYKVKVKLLKDEQKTPKELTTAVMLEEKGKNEGNKNEKINNSKEKNLEKNKEKKTSVHESLTGASVFAKRKNNFEESNGIIIYQTPDAKTAELIPVILAVTFALVIVVMAMMK